MGWLSPDKERDRFYLLPGMGGRALRRKQKTFLIWAVVAGSFVGLATAAVMFWLNTHGP
jgi:hypothetical protein